jgi:hypothetical protein
VTDRVLAELRGRLEKVHSDLSEQLELNMEFSLFGGYDTGFLSGQLSAVAMTLEFLHGDTAKDEIPEFYDDPEEGKSWAVLNVPTASPVTA